jgi:putative FmdB family regulatory protein
MPIYEYICEKCGAHTEVLQKVSDAPLKKCRECKGKLEKIVSRTSFQLKGSGWYKTDYSSKPSAKSDDKKADKGPAKTDSSSSSSSGDSGGGGKSE